MHAHANIVIADQDQISVGWRLLVDAHVGSGLLSYKVCIETEGEYDYWYAVADELFDSQLCAGYIYTLELDALVDRPEYGSEAAQKRIRKLLCALKKSTWSQSRRLLLGLGDKHVLEKARVPISHDITGLPMQTLLCVPRWPRCASIPMVRPRSISLSSIITPSNPQTSSLRLFSDPLRPMSTSQNSYSRLRLLCRPHSARPDLLRCINSDPAGG
jgi:hypothetical protein